MLVGIIIWTAIASLITAAMFVWEKPAAVNGNRKIPEKSLLVASALGGWPGALLVGQRIRHKTQKLSYRFWFGVTVLVNIVAIVGLLNNILFRPERFTLGCKDRIRLWGTDVSARSSLEEITVSK